VEADSLGEENKKRINESKNSLNSSLIFIYSETNEVENEVVKMY